MHSINYVSFEEKTSKNEIVATVQDWAREDSDAGGLYESIRFIDRVFDSEDEAHDYIESIDHSYGNFAVKYKAVGEKKSNKLKELCQKVAQLSKEYYAMNEECHFAEMTSAFIGCKKCGSKLSREYLVKGGKNFCPLCREDLRPKTTLDRIAKKKADWEKAIHLRDEEERKVAKASGVVKWLVKYEYHC